MENRLHFAGFCPAKEESGISKIERRLTRYSAKADTTRALGKTKYLFVGLSACAGTTMISMAFAEFIATSAVAAGCRATVVSNESTFSKKRAGTMQAAFVELCDGNDAPKGYDYDRIGIDRHFADRDYISFYKLLSEGRPLKGVCNADGGINWALRVPGEKFERPCAADLTRLFCDISGESIIGDLSGGFGSGLADSEKRMDSIRKMLNTADRVIAVIDPSPSAMMADPEKLVLLRKYAANGGDIVYLANKMTVGVNKKEMKSYLKLRTIPEIPYFTPADIHAAEYNCRSVLSIRPIAAELEKTFTDLLL